MLERDIQTRDQVLIAKDLAQIQSAAEQMQALLRDLLALSQVGQLMNTAVWVALRDMTSLTMLSGGLVVCRPWK
jgi:hypothetical protein